MNGMVRKRSGPEKLGQSVFTFVLSSGWTIVGLNRTGLQKVRLQKVRGKGPIELQPVLAGGSLCRNPLRCEKEKRTEKKKRKKKKEEEKGEKKK